MLKMRRALVLHATMTSKAPSTGTLTKTRKKPSTNPKVNTLAKPSTNGCKEFNSNKCFKGHDHPEFQHVCSFFLATINRVFPNNENSCKCKKVTKGKNS